MPQLQVVPLYCFDPRQFVETPWGNPKCGSHAAQFRLESVRLLSKRQAQRPVCWRMQMHVAAWGSDSGSDGSSLGRGIAPTSRTLGRVQERRNAGNVPH